MKRISNVSAAVGLIGVLVAGGSFAACSSDSNGDEPASPAGGAGGNGGTTAKGNGGTTAKGDGGTTAKGDGGDPRTGLQCKAPARTPNPQSGGVAGEIEPPPPSIGADVPATYFGPPPSSVNPHLVGPLTLLKSGSIDFEAGTITLPLYKGHLKDTGQAVWYLLTDTNDKAVAEGLGLNFSAKLGFGNVPGRHTARRAVLGADGSLTFDDGKVDFAPARALTPGAAPNYFPPAAFQPGSVGDADYSPLIYVENQGGTVYNAPVVAFGVEDADVSFCDGNPDYAKVHDKVVKFCPAEQTVTLRLTTGFSFGRPVFYLSTDASDALPASLEQVTVAPALAGVRVGGDDGAFSAIERLFSFVNGPVNDGEPNPQRQGLNSAIKDGRDALNVLGGIPTLATDYSPLWDFNLGEWTQDAIQKGYRSRLDEEFQILGFAARGFLTGPGGARYGSTGIVVDCPIVHRFL